MNKQGVKVNKTKNGINNALQTKTLQNLPMQWPENLTVLNLSGKYSGNIEATIQFPNLSDLNLSHNNLKVVPDFVLHLKKLQILDLSFNSIEVFDDVPEFCNSIERMDLSKNILIGPPYWVWSQSPKNLCYLNLSNNRCLTKSFENGYLEQLLSYATSLSEIELDNCHLKNKSLKLLSTLSKVKKLTMGNLDFNYLSTNYIIELPCEGLDTLCDIESLNVCNSHIYTINSNINMYKNLIEINLSENSIHYIPNEFCLLTNLEVCVLSRNKLAYLPENIQELTQLRELYVDNNELCMITENLCKLQYLSILDLYDNCINEVPEDLGKKVLEIDLAQNYFEESDDIDYVDKKQKLRLNKETRSDGRKIEVSRPESEYSPNTSDDENFLLSLKDPVNATQKSESSVEDWDSDNDDYWIPHPACNYNRPRSSFLSYVKKKMEEGNFCPIDLHTPSVSEMLSYEMENNPVDPYETEGQFSDY
ncbi:hypothetical protein K1T71_007015 [Dendrolimus kikuchii]|uniref:Uncharacterized protein n=1 Tax=Dendrolimus kikuchii TaxID=765133 RepID=A0ACC1CZJ3_9NEOP|nr:hypothetical protein K1T71_007015 [Dendrolimus kikuchii]